MGASVKAWTWIVRTRGSLAPQHPVRESAVFVGLVGIACAVFLVVT